MNSPESPLEDSSAPQPQSARPLRSRTQRKKNHWAGIDPTEFVRYPEYQRLSYMEEVRLIQQARRGDLAARNTLWVRNARLAMSVANWFRIPTSQLADAVQAGTIGLVRAIELYDIERYNAFSTYAWFWVYSHIQRYLWRSRYFVRIPMHLLNPVSARLRNPRDGNESPVDTPIDALIRLIHVQPLHKLKEAEHPPVWDQAPHLDLPEFRDEVQRLLHRREFDVIQRRFGLNGSSPQTLEQIGSLLQVTRERIRQLEKRALIRLQNTLPSRYRSLLDGDDSKTPQEPVAPSTNPDPQAIAPDTAPPREPPFRSISPEAMDQILFDIFRRYGFTFLQTNSLIYHYGLMRTPPHSIPQIAELLETTTRKVWLSLRRARKKFYSCICEFTQREFHDLRELIRNDPFAREAGPPQASSDDTARKIPVSSPGTVPAGSGRLGFRDLSDHEPEAG